MTDERRKQQVIDSSSQETSHLSRRTVLASGLALGAGALGVTNLSTLGAADDEKDDSTMCSTDVGSSASQKSKAKTSAFTVRIENVSTPMTLQTTSMDAELKEQPVPLSPGAFAVHKGRGPLFVSGEPERNNGIEEIAEDGAPARLTEWLAEQDGVSHSGAFTTPVGADAPAPLTPGSAYEFDIGAMPGDRLSLATMFVPSNDLFYSPDEMGIPLFASGEPIDRDVTDLLWLWDAGTEINEEPGVGENQVQRQRAAGVGLVERGTVAPISEVNGYSYPDKTDVIKVTVSPHSG